MCPALLLVQSLDLIANRSHWGHPFETTPAPSERVRLDGFTLHVGRVRFDMREMRGLNADRIMDRIVAGAGPLTREEALWIGTRTACETGWAVHFDSWMAVNYGPEPEAKDGS